MPCHGTKYHDEDLCDYFPNGDPKGIIVENVLDALYEANVIYYFGRLTTDTDKMIQVFNDHFETIRTRGTFANSSAYVMLSPECDSSKKTLSEGRPLATITSQNCSDESSDEIEDDDTYDVKDDMSSYIRSIDITDPALLLSTISSKVTESMTTSLSTSYSTHTAVNDMLAQFGKLNLTEPKWRRLRAESGKIFDIPLPENFDELLLDPALLFQARHSTFEPIKGSSIKRTQHNIDTFTAKTVKDAPAPAPPQQEYQCSVKIGQEPFARGSCRHAHYAQITLNPPSTTLPRLRSDVNSEASLEVAGIVKIPLKPAHNDSMTTGAYSEALKMQHGYAVAHFLATEFNIRIRNTNLPESTPIIQFNPLAILLLPTRNAKQRFATIEHDITGGIGCKNMSFSQCSSFTQAAQLSSGNKMQAKDTGSTVRRERSALKFEKYNGNHGLCMPSPTPSGTDHSAVQAFSHWTYEESRHEIMVVDCQGVFCPHPEEGGTFLLTDPAVHSDDVMKFGVSISSHV